ncbi:MAG TPA: YigZ family protein [Bacteroidales bacterium]|nr:YigZ family protein [Bacteroidales bacterium]
MLFDDTYKTIENQGEGLFKDRSSRFISFAIPVTNEEEIKQHLNLLRKKYHDARHHCYAYRLGFDKSVFRINDDGEPSGTAGKPIFGQMLSFDVTNILIVVIRYFGGIKLGVSGLINAYKTSAFQAITSTKIITKTVNDIYDIRFDYITMNEVMKIIKEENLELLAHNYESPCTIRFSVRKNDSLRVSDKLMKINNLIITFIKTA